MKEIDIRSLLEKAEGVQVVDFLEEVLNFIKDVQPILNKINVSIYENVQKMPGATKKLIKVTEATEVATTEILNTVDCVYSKVNLISELMMQTRDIGDQLKNDLLSISTILKNNESSDKKISDLLPDIQVIIDSIKNHYDSSIESNTKVTDKQVESINEDLTSIMMSLQVQDITTQQIAAVNHLLETMQDRLGRILTYFDLEQIQDLLNKEDHSKPENNISKLHRNIAFDPRAIDAITSKESRQEHVDELLKQHEEGTLDYSDNSSDSEEFSDIDIDALFNPPNLEPEKEYSFDEKINEQDNSEEFSQDDIDKLFG